MYLSLFNDKTVDKTNIQFDLADSEKVENQMKQSETAMEDYMTTPTDFRMSAPMTEEAVEKTAALHGESEFTKLNAFNTSVAYRDRMATFLSRMEMLKEASARDAEDAFNHLAHDTKILVANGESIADIAKLACKYCEGEGVSMEKISAAYNEINKVLVADGFRVNSEFTKVSSYHIDKESSFFNPIRDYVLALEKYAGFHEIVNGVKDDLDRCNLLVNAIHQS